MSGEKITYLLGAGASAGQGGLPTQHKIGDRVGLSQAMRNLVKNINGQILPSNLHKIHQNFIDDLNWLADESDKFGSVDTYAKFLYVQGHVDTGNAILKKLKVTLTLFFTIEQFIYKKFDNRYLTFLVTLLGRRYSFPINIKILNWNYDFQIQIAEYNLFEDPNKMGNFIHYYPPVGLAYAGIPLDYNLIHVNGIAGFYYSENTRAIETVFLYKSLEKLYETIQIIKDNSHLLLSFAWEVESMAARKMDFGNQGYRLQCIKEMIKATKILVVIGYSFPFFNREIDREIFEELKRGGLRKIYFQDPLLDGQFLQNQFNLGTDVVIENIMKKDEYYHFYVPYELS